MRNKLLWIILAVAAAAAAVICGVMLVAAARFSEWGRMIFYTIFTLFACEAAGFSVYRFIKEQKKSS